MARTSTRTFRVVPGNTQQWDRFLTDFLLGLTDVEATNLADMAALSVMGRATNTAGPPADIIAGSDLTVLRRSGTSVGFGTISSAYVNDFTEASQDITGALIQNGTGITWSYNDGAGTLTGTVSLGAFSTTNLSEGTNLYFTDERAQDAVGTILADTSTIDLTYSDATPSITAAVIADSISNTLLANMADSTMKGRAVGAGTGDPTDLSLAQIAAIVAAANIGAPGTYTPTLTNVTNLDGSTAQLSHYVRLGSMVIVMGFAGVDPTAAGSTELGISLPIASNFAANTQLIGVAAALAISGQSAGILADVTNDRARMIWNAVDTTNNNMFYLFMYLIV